MTLPATLRRLLPLLVLAAGSHAWAWGCAGHQIVAAIALLQLDPATRAELNAILAADPRPIPPTRACPGTGLPLLVLSAPWADVRRNRATAPDHYVDLPLALARAHYAEACAEHCVSWAIRHSAQVLADSDDPAARGKALRYLVHFVGDVHQPLHTLADGRGGATTEVYLDGRATMLHAAWDSGMPADLESGLSTTAYAAQLDRQLGRAVAAERGNDNPEAWASQSHALAARIAFAGLPTGGGELSAAYLATADDAVELQLERAGQRLARQLRQLTGERESGFARPRGQ